MKEKKREVFSWMAFLAAGLIIWQIVSVFMDNSILAPSPAETFQEMLLILQSKTFFQSFGATLYRSLLGLFISFASGIGISVLAVHVRLIRTVFDRLCPLIQVIPNAALIILILFWMSRDGAVSTVIFLLVFPVVYRAFLASLLDLEKRNQPVFKLYPQPFLTRFRYAVLPSIRPVFVSSLLNSLSLSLKSAVMAEILASVSFGIGRQIQNARMNLNVAAILAWVILLALLTLLLEQLLKWGINRLFLSASDS